MQVKDHFPILKSRKQELPASMLIQVENQTMLELSDRKVHRRFMMNFIDTIILPQAALGSFFCF